jgi:hypothetical protein
VTYVGRPEESQKLTEELGLAMTIFYSYFIDPVVYPTVVWGELIEIWVKIHLNLKQDFSFVVRNIEV